MEPVCAAMSVAADWSRGKLPIVSSPSAQQCRGRCIPRVGEEAASLLPVGDALVGVLGADLLDVLDVVREVEGGASLDVDAALGAL